MKLKFLAQSIVVVFTLFALASCTELDLHYEGGTADDDQLGEATQAIPKRADAAVNGMYALLGKPYVYFGEASGRADDMGYMSVCLGQDLNSGDMTNIVSGYDWFSVALEYSDRTPTYANPQIRNGLFYKIIYSTRDVLTMIPDGTDNAELMAKRGQAKAMRAFSYLSLAPYFQFKYKGNEDKPSVPLADETVDPRNNPRVTLQKLYEVIIQDLTDAIADLDGFVRPNKGTIDQKVAYGLRARAYLNMEMWAEAAADAEKALVGFTPYGINDLKAPGFYNATDPNWIWAILLPADVVGQELATWPSQIGSFSGNAYVPYAGIWRSINKLLYDKIPSTDVRKKWWLDSDTASSYLDSLTWTDYAKNITYKGQEIPGAVITDVKVKMEPYANVKFGQRSGVGEAVNDGDWCLMRAEEMILLRAEALAKAGDLPAGKTVLEDFVKTYRSPAYTSTASTLADFENEVWLQRRIELWGEGFAMADVMRLGKNVVRYHPGKATNVPEDYQFNISANDPWLLLRFVQRETTNNVAIVQNTGGTQPSSGNGADLLDGVTD
ncbi:MAG TPA: RagB/SusD family nutrient uptake outer membrane protein [Bacteroidales bacterium]|nr:RagB/SusD family nutrient uptake outer membrane protein [Bacteroidales bacterium]